MTAELVAAWCDGVRLELEAAGSLRHDLHADPRLSDDEDDTASLVAAAIGRGPGERVARTGRLIDLGGEGEIVVVRAELDALPLRELSEVSWRSTSPVMHACGHDVHLAALVAVARAASRITLPCRLLALLQPREEVADSGATDVVEHGLADSWGAVVAAHVQPQLGPGVIAATPGPVNASTSEFSIEVRGRGGHSGYPHTVDDSVLALSAIVTELQQVPARTVDPVRGCALMVNQLRAGEAANVVPATAFGRGTVRTMTVPDHERACDAMSRIVHHVAAAHGCEASLDFDDYEPALVNDPSLAAHAGSLLVGMGHVVDAEWRSFGSDDFSQYATRTRSLMLFVGTGEIGGGGLHDPRYVPPDAYIGIVAEAMVAGLAAAAGRHGDPPAGPQSTPRGRN